MAPPILAVFDLKEAASLMLSLPVEKIAPPV